MDRLLNEQLGLMAILGIEVLEQERRFIKQARKDVETQAQRMLEQGMTTQVNTNPAHQRLGHTDTGKHNLSACSIRA